jgi:hypothetical protein
MRDSDHMREVKTGHARHLWLLQVRAVSLGAILTVAVVSLNVTKSFADIDAHTFSSSFGTSGQEAGQMKLSGFTGLPSDVAINDTTHDVYVADTFNNRVDEFGATGTFIRAWGWGVADGAKSFESCTSSCLAGVRPESETAQGAGQFNRPNFIAVDNSGGASKGDVYVGEAISNSVSHSVVQKFDASGGLVTGWGNGGQLNGETATGGPFTSVAGIAVNPAGELLVYDRSTLELFSFSQDATPVATTFVPDETVANGIGVDAAGDLYKVTENIQAPTLNLEQFESTGGDIGNVTADLTGANEVIGLAINAVSGDVYVDVGGLSQGGTQIRHYTDPSSSGPASCVPQHSCVAADTFGKGELHEAGGVAVDPSTEDVYVADAGDGRIAVYASPPPAAPSVSNVSASDVTASTADLHASINPNQRDTHYRFEYGTSTSYGTNVPVPDGDVGSGFGNQAVTSPISGLLPNTEYHYRLVAENTLGTTVGGDHTFNYSTGQEVSAGCQNKAFRDGPSASLPDCRAYELVSPAFANGQPIFADAMNGDRVFYQTLGAPGAAVDNPTAEGASYAAHRTAEGWESTPLDPPAAQFETGERLVATLEAVSSTLESELFVESANVPYERGFNVGWQLREPDGTFREVGPAVPRETAAALEALAPASLSGPSDMVHNQAESDDLSTVLFSTEQSAGSAGTLEDPDPLANWHWPGDSTDSHEPSLYEYSGTGNVEPVLVGVRNEGALHGTPHLNDGAELISECGTGLGSGPEAGSEVNKAGSWSSLDRQNAVSGDGNIVYFTPFGPGQRVSGCTGATPPADELFARIGGSKTVPISEPTATDCTACDTTAPQDAVFQGASHDGSMVFFLTAQALLPGNPGENLYEYDFNAPPGNRVTAISHIGSGSAAEVLGEVALSNDGARVYFVARGVLTTVANGVGATAIAGAPNLYVYDTQTRTMGFVATLASDDAAEWAANVAERKVDINSNGGFLLFLSSNNVTPDASGSEAQLYLYDAETANLTRISIGNRGFNDNGNNLSAPIGIAGGGLAFSEPEPLRHSMSDDGSYVFFESAAALTPNGLDNACAHEEGGVCRVSAENVYEYHEGQVSLISDGQDRHAVLGASTTSLVGTDASGANVFIHSADPLASPDSAVQRSIYDVRIGGGLPAPAAGATCQEGACQGPVAPAPATPIAASSTFAGAGNLAPAAPSPSPRAKPKQPPTRGQKLARALKACKQKPKKRRAACEKQARRSYGPQRKQAKPHKQRGR